jgi:hypothetical protein
MNTTINDIIQQSLKTSKKSDALSALASLIKKSDENSEELATLASFLLKPKLEPAKIVELPA